jgi:hypothetical protein
VAVIAWLSKEFTSIVHFTIYEVLGHILNHSMFVHTTSDFEVYLA